MFRDALLITFLRKGSKLNSHTFSPELLVIIINAVYTLSHSFSLIYEVYSELLKIKI